VIGIWLLARPALSVWERVTRIELALSAWEADVLPLNYTRVAHSAAIFVAADLDLPRHDTGCRAGANAALARAAVPAGPMTSVACRPWGQV
jgi:hypothetical protein